MEKEEVDDEEHAHGTGLEPSVAPSGNVI